MDQATVKGDQDMIETAMVFDRDGRVLRWHRPSDATGVSLPDSRSLWEVLWDARADVAGVAHTHPWGGVAHPSHEDLTTFWAIDRALGRALIWPVLSTGPGRPRSRRQGGGASRRGRVRP